MLYGLVLRIRHLFYDKGWAKSIRPSVASVCVGNITAGGTGKTPHTEMILRLLVAAGKQPSVLSRGYKRKSKGFHLVPANGSAALYGDEPVQIAHKFPGLAVGVDKNRVHGCEALAGTDVVVLDDAYQYRKLSAHLNIVLVDYNHPVHKDRLLPWGHLRDLPERLGKAQVVILTKCPDYMDEWECSQWRKSLKLGKEQKLFFTTLRYCQPEPVFPEGDRHYLYARQVTLVTGIANDAPLRRYLSDTYKMGRRIQFPDHHNYTRGDVRTLLGAVKEMPTACLMTTEKDACRLRDVKDMPMELRQRLFYVPIEAAFLSEKEEADFSALLLAAVE